MMFCGKKCFVFMASFFVCYGRLELQSFIKPNILPPPIPNRPFVSVWNADTGLCIEDYNISIDLSFFDIIHNHNQAKFGEKMVILYKRILGLYPYYDNNGHAINGGIPQLGNLAAHLEKCKQVINELIPDIYYDGLAVIDWESWRPVWVQNGWGERKIYQTASLKKVKRDHPNWNKEQILTRAKKEFETSAKEFFIKTLRLCIRMRPKAKWGYYHFPYCYNNGKTETNLTCHGNTIPGNDQIEWLFDMSRALYPSTYLGLWFKNKTIAANYTANRIGEATRVDKNRSGNTSIPIYVYNNIDYRKSNQFLLLKDVVDSSGVAAVQGASGVVLWSHSTSGSKERCLETKHYVETILGPYLKLASDSASECSLEKCSGQGRCIITQPYLSTLSKPFPKLMEIFLKSRFLSQEDYGIMCQCYEGFFGKVCQFNK